MFNMINFNYFLNIQEDTAMKQDKNSSIDTPLKNRLDWVTTIIPFVTILALCSLFMIFPDASSLVLGSVRFFLGDQFGSYYLLLGLGALICSLYMAFSRYGRIKLGNLEKPQYSSFQWGSMMFTAGLAADILFYSLCEWMLYAGEPHITDMGAMQDWASTYPCFTGVLFHGAFTSFWLSPSASCSMCASGTNKSTPRHAGRFWANVWTVFSVNSLT